MKRYLISLIIIIQIIYSSDYKLPPKAILDVFEAPQNEIITLVTGTNKVIEYTYSRYKSLENR